MLAVLRPIIMHGPAADGAGFVRIVLGVAKVPLVERATAKADMHQVLAAIAPELFSVATELKPSDYLPPFSGVEPSGRLLRFQGAAALIARRLFAHGMPPEPQGSDPTPLPPRTGPAGGRRAGAVA
jgi:hypothetical protein